ncbi:uncharacterized protein LOC118750361 [Rhagoletis pomonella]|uniref:uncharacterized protein LOC118750361 n=1 Tax=Rhagoletis pomonella TaxID=28610 RepID=UPI00177D8B1A|nr:uncharacterized protein LOC118750361 [Rhagoletis pomonella]
MSCEENTIPEGSAVPSSSASAIISVTASPVAPPSLQELATIEAPSQTWTTALIDRESRFVGAISAQEDVFSGAIALGTSHIGEHSQMAPLASTTVTSCTSAGATLSDTCEFRRSNFVTAHTCSGPNLKIRCVHSASAFDDIYRVWPVICTCTWYQNLSDELIPFHGAVQRCRFSGASQVQAPYAPPCTAPVWTSRQSQPFSFIPPASGLPNVANGSQSAWGAMGQSGPYTTYDATLLPSHVAARQAITKDLPSFSGKPEALFITNYVQSTERCGFSDQENLIRLQKCLKGAALESVRGKLMMPATVNLAIETLRMLFGRPDVIHETLQRKLREVPPVRIERLESFGLAVQNYRATMQALGLDGYLNDPMLLNELLSKLPSEMKLEWGRRRLSLARVDIIAFDEWLVPPQSLHQVTPVNSVPSEVKVGNKGRRERLLVHDASSTSASRTPGSQKVSCHKCTGAHDLAECREFKALSRQLRWQLIKEKRLCIRCFKNHQVRRCNSNKWCGVDGCRLAHNPLLHGQRLQQQTKPHESDDTGNAEVENSVICLHQKPHDRAIFRYVPVTLHANGVTLETVALIDEGASCTLLDDTLARQLKLSGPSEDLCLRWTGNITQQDKNSQIVSFEISARGNDSVKYGMRSVRTIANLKLPRQSLQVGDIRERDHLKSLPIVSYDSSRAGLLIGLDRVKLCVPLEVRQNQNDGLVAARCRLGWSVYGRDKHDRSPNERLMHICECSKDGNLDNLMRSFFSVESVGISPTVKPPMSKDDERAWQIMQSTTKYVESERRWETGLLWRFDRIDLPQSYQMALKRLECLERKMDKDPHLKDFITECIQDYLRKGYVRKLSADEISTGGKAWYIPIFSVISVNKGKRRLVWDAAAKVEGTALNDVLLKGPDLLRSLVGVLLRFREKPVALCGDIREMSHQVGVIKADQAAQQFLWRDGDRTREPDTFVMVVMTLGASCSPSLANYIKNRNAYRFKDKFTSAVAAIVENTFVGDWLQSVETEDEMILLATEVPHIHKEGGFEMRHWLSNSKRVSRVMAGQSGLVDKCIEEPGNDAENVLGMWWRPHTDELMFVQQFKEQFFDELSIPTKREILRAVMTIFDPLGLLGFFVIKAKMILQDVWRSGVTWDEPIQDKERFAWWNWVRKLQSLNNVRIPRCYTFVSRCENLELHVFVDSSILAYAAVAYLRAEVKGEFYCSLVISKTRVAPLKPLSVPRLELMAAILGLRLARFAQDELSVAISRRVFWSDSKDVLYWIRSDARKFNQFVAVRIGEILQGSQLNEWRWVSSKQNVADDGTKWDDNLTLDSNARWFTGPDFLRAPEHSWPQSEFIMPHEEGLDTVHHVNDEMDVRNSCVPDPTRFSKWERLRAVQMCVLRFLRLIMKSEAKNPVAERLLREKTCDGAELLIFRECQSESFAEELNQLKQPKARMKMGSYE